MAISDQSNVIFALDSDIPWKVIATLYLLAMIKEMTSQEIT
ncbi:MAG: hypothetical protein V3T49_00820 [Dehalococcoidia bacterium]